MEVTNAKNTINNFKRLIGRRYHDSFVQQEKQLNAYSIIEGPNGSVNIEVRPNGQLNSLIIEFVFLG